MNKWHASVVDIGQQHLQPMLTVFSARNCTVLCRIAQIRRTILKVVLKAQRLPCRFTAWISRIVLENPKPKPAVVEDRICLVWLCVRRFYRTLANLGSVKHPPSVAHILRAHVVRNRIIGSMLNRRNPITSASSNCRGNLIRFAYFIDSESVAWLWHGETRDGTFG